jgi:hypothetical protein
MAPQAAKCFRQEVMLLGKCSGTGTRMQAE